MDKMQEKHVMSYSKTLSYHLYWRKVDASGQTSHHHTSELQGLGIMFTKKFSF